MKLKNQIMLITYADSMGKDLPALHRILNRYFQEAVGGVHILPFFPSSADRGFAPTRYDMVDPKFGTFADVSALGEDYYLMFDFMVNHISHSSPYFQDFLKNKDASPYKDYFIRYKDFWQGGEPTKEQVDAIYKRKPRAPYIEAKFADGSKEKVWCTFCEEQVDLNVSKASVMQFIRETLVNMCCHGASLIRLDAFAYAVKKPGGSCFFEEPEIWDLLHAIEQDVKDYQVEILPEIHEHYTIQMKIAQKGYWIYDFALPVLLLHAIYTHNPQYLKKWLGMSPKKQFTTLDTHDGIGIVDVKDLLPDDQILLTKEKMFTEGANVKKIYNTAAYHNLDIYQINTTYYSALGNHDDAYLLARAVQFFAPGIPQVYYVGLLAGRNDIELMEQTKNGRDINRHYYTEDEIAGEVKRPVVQRLIKLMKLRNTHPAFALDGNLQVSMPEQGMLVMRRTFGSAWAELTADFIHCSFHIEHS